MVFSQDARSNTCRNIKFLRDLTNTDVTRTPKFEFKHLLSKSDIPPNDSWRKSLIQLFLAAKKNPVYRNQLNLSETYVISMLESLCSS